MDVTAKSDGEKITITVGAADASVMIGDIAAAYDMRPETSALFMALHDIVRKGETESVRNPGEFTRDPL